MQGQVQLVCQTLLFEIWLESTKPELPTSKSFALDGSLDSLCLGVSVNNLEMDLQVERLDEAVRTSLVEAGNVSSVFVANSSESCEDRVVIFGWEVCV